MDKYASKVVGQAQAWLGKKESDGSHKEIIDVYNSHKPLARGYAVKYTDAWCSTFVSAVAIKLGYTDIIPTECGCEKHVQLFKNIGEFVENENVKPAEGWIIFYDWSDNGIGDNRGNADHVGIVEKVEGSTITVIEGNINNSVGRRTLQVNGRYIRGYGVPKYDKEIVQINTKSIDEVARLVIKGDYGNGRDRREALEKEGYDYNQVQARVNEIMAGKTATKSVDELAQEVIKGLWGNGADRKNRLTAAGYDYNAVQKRVNELLK